MVKSKRTLWEILGLLILLPGALIGYLSFHEPDISASGQYSQWFLPQQITGLPLNTIFWSQMEGETSAEYFKNIRSFITLDINNGGSDTAREVEIHLPFNGVFSVDDGKTLKVFSEKITIPDLKPSDGQNLTIWTPTSIGEWNRKEIKINFTEGVVGVDFGYHVYGVKGSVFNFFYSNFLLSVLLLASIIFIIVVIFLDMKSPKLNAKTDSLNDNEKI